MRPSLRPGGAPPFHELDEYTFENLCRDLFDEQPGIATYDNYGKRGQRQDGIDLYARRSADESIEVGQCKRYQKFPARKFRQATDEFFKHWDRWSREGVRRFILFVACDVNSREQQDEISKQRARFAERNILYEVWSASKIRKELAPHRHVARQHLRDEYWVREICGDDSAGLLETGSDDRHAVLAGAVLTQNVHLAAWASHDAKNRIGRAREAWREGRPNEARRQIEELRDISRGPWQSLSDDTRARVLRFEASLALAQQGDIESAQRLADEADRLAPAESPVLRALIAHRRTGPETALSLLTDAVDMDSLNLKAAFLLDLGRVEEGLAIVEQVVGLDAGSAEAYRLRAYGHLFEGRRAEARLAAARALELAPQWTSVRLAAAVADYASTLSPSVPAGYLFPWPEPTDWSLVRRDGESLVRLRGAAEVFRVLAESTTDTEEQRSHEAWRLACLGNDPERQEGAVALCRTLLDRDPVHHQAIAWAVPRRWSVDLDASRTALESLLASSAATLPQIVALIRIHLRFDRAPDAAAVLDEFRTRFEAEGADALWRILRAQAAVQAGDDAALAAATANASSEARRRVQTLALSARARSADDWEPLLRHLEASYKETGDPALLLSWCEASMSRDAWTAVAARSKELVRLIATADVVRLAAIASYNAGDFDRCLAFLDGHRHSFEDGRLPSDLRELRVRCQRARGFLPDALVEAEALVREDPSTNNLLHLAEIHIEKGDFSGLVRVARRLVGCSDVSTASLLRLARILAVEDVRLATSFWRRAVAADLPDDLVPHAYLLGHHLGREREVAVLSRRFFHLAQQGHAGAQLASVQDFIVYVQQRREQAQASEAMYTEGTAPVHFLVDRAGGSLAFPYRHTRYSSTKPRRRRCTSPPSSSGTAAVPPRPAASTRSPQGACTST